MKIKNNKKMKILNQIFIISCLYFFINSTCETDEDDISHKYRYYEDCKDRSFDEEELEFNAYRCCHIEKEIKTLNTEKEIHGCIPITQSQYENIKRTINDLESEEDVRDVDLDCESYFIQYGLFSMVLFLL